MQCLPVKYALGNERREMPGLIGSASTRGGVVTLSVVNPHATLPVEADIELRGVAARGATIEQLRHDELTAHNTFDDPDAVLPTEHDAEPIGPTWAYRFPPASVSVLRIH
jgi:alpha-N-arabinofuranosidase